ncbi:MAG: InlB B-repeat-containing protein, partial [bacterium]|nr:InlB B-repeat-containing protein [bacterium]
HKFKHWIDKASNSVVSTNANYSFNVTKNITLQAVFEEAVQKFTVTAESNNTTWGTVNPASQTVNANTQVTVTASTIAPHKFKHWIDKASNSVVSTNPSYSFTATKNVKLQAVFEEVVQQFTVTAESNNTAWGTVNPATQTVNANTQVTVTATAQQGFNFIGWFENGNLVHNQSAYTFNVTANRTLEARFAAQPKPKFTITTSVKDNLGGSASPQAQEIEQGQAATVTATAQQGFNFVGWFENGNLVHNQATYTFNVSANRTLEARFAAQPKPKFTITTSVKDNLGGSASPQTQEIEQGQPATVTAVAQQGFDFLGWFENGNLVHNQTTYTFNVTANRTLEARFNEVINPKNLLPHLKNFGSAPFKKGQQYEPFIWEEMIPNANPNSFKIIVINSTSSTILESNNYSVTKNDQEGLSISFKQTGKFTVTIQFEAEGQTYFVSYDIVVE